MAPQMRDSASLGDLPVEVLEMICKLLCPHCHSVRRDNLQCQFVSSLYELCSGGQPFHGSQPVFTPDAYRSIDYRVTFDDQCSTVYTALPRTTVEADLRAMRVTSKLLSAAASRTLSHACLNTTPMRWVVYAEGFSTTQPHIIEASAPFPLVLEALHLKEHFFVNLKFLNVRVVDFDSGSWQAQADLAEHSAFSLGNLPKKLVKEGDDYFPNLEILSVSPSSASCTALDSLCGVSVWRMMHLCLLSGVPRLSTLSLHHLSPHDAAPGSSVPYFAGLRALEQRSWAVTRLELHFAEINEIDLDHLMSAFSGLQEFVFKTHVHVWGLGEERNPARLNVWPNAESVVSNLWPLQHQLQVLEIDFAGAVPEYQYAGLNQLTSLIHFQKLRDIKLDVRSVVDDFEPDFFETLVNMLPASVERLTITEVPRLDIWSNHHVQGVYTPGTNPSLEYNDVYQLAIATSRGRLPLLSFVRLEPQNERRYHAQGPVPRLYPEQPSAPAPDLQEALLNSLDVALSRGLIALQKHLGSSAEDAEDFIFRQHTVFLSWAVEPEADWVYQVFAWMGIKLEAMELLWPLTDTSCVWKMKVLHF